MRVLAGNENARGGSLAEIITGVACVGNTLATPFSRATAYPPTIKRCT
jgi:hypothetical protein